MNWGSSIERETGLQRWAVGLGVFSVHALVIAGLVVTNPMSRNQIGSKDRKDTVSKSLAYKQVLQLRIVQPDSVITVPSASKQAAGPIASDTAPELSSAPIRPEKIQLRDDAQIRGVDVPARAITGLEFQANWVPAHVEVLRVKLWIDASGTPEQVELLSQLDDPESEELLKQAFLSAVFIPAERQGHTVASTAIFEFRRGSLAGNEPLTE